MSKFAALKPRALMVVLTYRCNSKCKMCNIWKMEKFKEFCPDQWRKVFNDSYLSEIETLTITGGEAMLSLDYIKTIEEALVSLPSLKRLVLTSNGFLTERIKKNVRCLALRCRKMKIRLSISISLDGVECDHEEIRGVTGSFKKVVATLDELRLLKKRYGVAIMVAGVLMKDNLGKYWSFKKWLKQKKLDYSFQLVGFHETYVNNRGQEKSLNFAEEQSSELQRVLEDIKTESESCSYGLMSLYWDDMKQMYLGNRRHVSCPFLFDEMAIDCLGNVYFCLSSSPIGNMVTEDRSAGEICIDKKNQRRRKAMWMDECRYCNSGCDVVRAIVGNPGDYLKYKILGSV